MNLEDRFAESDPARGLQPLTAEARAELVELATNSDRVVGMPSNRRPRRLVAVAAVAALVIAIPLAQSRSHGPARLVLSASQAQGGGQYNSVQTSLAGSGESKVASDAMMWMLPYKFEASSALAGDAGTGFAYSVAARADANSIIERVLAKFDLPALTSDGGEGVQANVMDAKGMQLRGFYAYLPKTGAWSNFNYWDQTVDPWSKCNSLWAEVKQSAGTDSAGQSAAEQCQPDAPTNLLTKSEAIAKMQSLLREFGLQTTDLSYDFYQDETNTPWGNSVTATLLVDGMPTPISWSANFVDNGVIQGFGGSLDAVSQLAQYDYLSADAALARLQQINDKQADQWRKQMAEQPTQPLPSDTNVTDASGSGTAVAGSSGSSTGGAGTEPSSPIAEPMPMPAESAPVFDPNSVERQVVHVTAAKRTLTWAQLKDGSSVLLPAWTFVGYLDDPKWVFEYGSVIAVVDDQIELDAFYSNNNFGIAYMARGQVAVK